MKLLENPYFLLIVLLALCGAVGAVLLYRSSLYKKGVLGKKQVAGKLKKFAGIRNYKILNDIVLTDGAHTAAIDHLMVGFFGLLFVTTLQNTGDYYGDDKTAQWAYTSGNNKYYFPNPTKENQKNMEVVRSILAKNEVYNIQMECITVISGRPKVTKIFVPKTSKIASMEEFGKFLHSSRFEKDNDVDVEQLTALLGKAKR